jgi:hypothetical protein
MFNRDGDRQNSRRDVAALAQHPTGCISLSRVRPGVLLVEFDGEIEPLAADWLMSTLDQHVGGDCEVVFFDTTGLHQLGSRFQKQMTKWALRNRERLAGAHVLTGRPVVRMAVSVANMSLDGWLIAHDSAAKFYAALEAAGRA